MQESIRPVVKFLSGCQLELHEAVFVRTGIPGHNQTEKYMETEDTIKHMIDLVTYICNSSKKRLNMLSSLLVDPVIRTILEDIKDENDYTIETMSLSSRELGSLSKQLKYFLEEHHDRVQAVFAIIGTVFLPLTFVTGVFGMNFKTGGILVKELNRSRTFSCFSTCF